MSIPPYVTLGAIFLVVHATDGRFGGIPVVFEADIHENIEVVIDNLYSQFVLQGMMRPTEEDYQRFCKQMADEAEQLRLGHMLNREQNKQAASAHQLAFLQAHTPEGEEN